MEFGLYIVLWVITFPIAWWSLIKYVSAISARDTKKAITHLSLYLLIIATPYAPFVFSGERDWLVNLVVTTVFITALLSAIATLVKPQKVTRMLWSGYARVYHVLLGFAPYREMADLICKEIETRAFGRPIDLLDLGAGSGLVEQRLEKRAKARVATMHLSDTITQMLNSAGKRLPAKSGRKIEFHVASHLECATSHTGAKYDAIILSNTLYTLSKEEKGQLLSIVRSRMKSDSILVITDPHTASNKGLLGYHAREKGIALFFNPKFWAVAFFDFLINELSSTTVFNYTQPSELEKIANENSLTLASKPVKVYGGAESGISYMYTLIQKSYTKA